MEGRLWGVIIVASIHAAVLPPGTDRELVAFTGLVATAIANAEARAELTASRARIVTSADETRRRIVRDLHDGAQSRLVQTILSLELAARARRGRRRAGLATARRGAGLGEGRQHDRRDLVQGILPSGLARGGLASAVEGLVERLRIPVSVDVAPDRFRPEIEANAYFVIAEALTNVVKHSGARQATVRVWAVDELGGRRSIDSPRAGGTRIAATLPP